MSMQAARASRAEITRAVRDFRAQFWSREWFHLNQRRALWVSIGLALNLFMLLTSSGWTSAQVVVGYLSWLLVIGCGELLRRRLTDRDVILTWSAIACILDVLFVTVQMYNTGGGWWLGVPFLGIITAIAATSLPRGYGVSVFVAALVSWTLLLGLQLSGALRPVPWFGLPEVGGNAALITTQFLLGSMALSAIWVLLRGQARRARRPLESYRRMVEASPFATFTMGRDGRVREVNPAAVRLTALSADQLLGHGVLRYVLSEQQPMVLAAFEQTLSGEMSRIEHGFHCGDGVVRWFSVTYSPIDTHGDDPVVLAIAQDLTAERNAAIANEALQRELAESRRMQLVGRLVSGVAHELNNPLAAVMSFTEQLLQESHETEQRAALHVVHEQAGRARAIVRDLLQVVRDRGERERQATSVEALLASCVHTLQRDCEAARVTVVSHTISAGPPALVDPTGLAQVFDNILRNALLASPPDSTITTTLAYLEDGWRISICDQGAGVPLHARAHLFEPFFTTRSPGEGTGLGLAVSQGIVDQHGGTLVLEDTPGDSGVGATFTVFLPSRLAERNDTGAPTVRTASHEIAVPFPMPVAESAVSQSPSLLLIDDEPAIRMALERYLTRRGWSVETCASGIEGREALMAAGAETRYNAIVCDLKMPGMTGIELYRHLEANRPALIDKLIFATGDVASQDVALFLESVTCPVLEKPFSLTSLAELLESRRGSTTPPAGTPAPSATAAASDPGAPAPTRHP
jgi:two-component system NtrC family sensor kinase